ncbi:MAG TPA: fibronectin type III domain-containing protein, partial [Polyangiaceae bacterium]|nr:fibronectin type III domain-containing protein [Polyangiaceae bacterium]
GCSNFTQVATTSSTSFSNTGLSASTSYGYRVRATDAAGNFSLYSNAVVAFTPAPPDTQPPSAPANLSATTVSGAQINLSWSAATDNVGVTNYLIERCTGTSCANFLQIATGAGTTFSDTGLSAGVGYSYRVRATDAAGNLSGYSNTASATTTPPPDTQAPTAPANVAVTVVSNSQLNLSWTASTDNVGVTAYLVERCQGAGCSNFTQTTTTTGTSSSDTTLQAATSYSYRVRATDAAGNRSSYSVVASGVTSSGAPANPTFVQGTYADPQVPSSLVTVRFAGAQSAGDLNVVAVGWNDTTAQVTNVSDSSGNVYTLAVGPTVRAGFGSQSIYYAKNIAAAAANTNTVSVTFSPAADYPDVRIAQYHGIDPVNPLDVVAVGQGAGSNAVTSAVTTTNSVDLLVGANMVSTITTSAGTGFTSRMISDPDSDILEDRVVTAAGSYSASSSLLSGSWIMQLVAFRGAGSPPPPPDTTPPSAPSSLLASAASTTQINLSFTAATDNIQVTGYLVESCTGASCSNFTQIATSTTTSLNVTGLSIGTSYSYRVRATDAAGNLGPYSNTASATTLAPDTQPPSAPANLVANASSASQVDLSWSAASDNVAVTGYLVESCAGAGCANFTQVASTTALTWSNAGLSSGQSYSYRVRATDAAGNLGAYSGTASATTPAPDTQAPSAPSTLAATTVSGTQIALTWGASTDDVAVTGYLLERCTITTGYSCSAYAQIATTTGLSYTDGGLTPGGKYRYRVRATDGAGNLSAYSNTSTATTTAPDAVAPSAPANLTATLVSNGEIDLSWGAATDNVGVTAYMIERCQGLNCTNFAYTTAAMTTTSSDTTLSAGTSYSYRVQATDAAGNLSAYSNVATAATPGVAANPAYVQGNYADPQGPSSMVSVAYTQAQLTGDLNVVAIGWNDTSATINSVSDTKGNVYTLAVGPTIVAGIGSHAIYYAKNVASASAGSNTVSVAFTPAAAYPDVRIAEYSGLDSSNPLDVVATGQGNSALSSTSSVLTSSTTDLLVAANLVTTTTSGPGAGFTQRMITVPNADILEDRVVNSAGSYNATAPVALGGWIMQMVAFRAGAPVPVDTTPPSVALTSPAAGATLSGVVTVSVTANDNESGIQSVQLLVDGNPIGVPSTSSPYSFLLDTATFGNGAHTLGASALNGAQLVGSATSVSVTLSNSSSADPAVVGQWSGAVPMPLVSVHQTLLSNGKILMSDGQIWGPDARVWDYTTDTYTAVPAPVNIFCGAHDQMPDGRILVVGGHITAHMGLTAANIFNPNTQSWTVAPDMATPRWYPTVTGLPDGRQLVTSGESNCEACFVNIQEIFNPATNSWTRLTSAPFTFAYYPHVFVLPNGRVIVTSTTEHPMVSQVLDLNALTWTAIGGPEVDGGSAAMYLPGKFLKTGTSCDPDAPLRNTATTAYVLDANQSSPTWRQVASMQYPRTFHVETILPDGNVLVTGGGPTTAALDVANGILPAEMWSPTSETFTSMAAMHVPRLYHATALLLPDGRVVVGGGGRFDNATLPTDQFTAEFYSPPYLFKGPRPVISSAPSTLQYGQSFSVQTPDAARIASVSLIRFGSTTHQINMAQRFLPLTFTASSSALTVTAPANSNLAIPGYYMLFIVDTNGVPSVAATVHF